MQEQDRKQRGAAGQERMRRMEREMRKSAVAFGTWCGKRGLTRRAAGERLGLAPETLRAWEREWRKDRMSVESRGRPARREGFLTRETMRAIFQLMGPGVGMPTLEAIFPGVALRELEDFAARYREEHKKKNQVLIHALRWWYPNSVWAIDFTQPLTPIDGIYRYILVVRDLASGYMLWTMPCVEATALEVCRALEALFRAYGAPLVIKSDNGSHFTAQEVRALLARWKIQHLLSPPGLPSYNGSIEAGIGSLTTRMYHLSARSGRPGQYTTDDVEAARLQANEVVRPWGKTLPSPKEAWEHRPDDLSGLRARLARTMDAIRDKVRAEAGYLPIDPLPQRDQDAVNRMVISRALVECGVLTFRRRRIRLPIKRRGK